MRLGDPFYVYWSYSTYIADMRGRNATLPVDGLCYGISDRGDGYNRVCDADDEVSTYTMQIGDTYTLVEVPPISKYECANRIANLALSSSKGIFGFNSGGSKQERCFEFYDMHYSVNPFTSNGDNLCDILF